MKTMSILGAFLALALLSGCAGFGGKALDLFDKAATKAEAVSDRAMDEAAASIDFYCENAPEDRRMQLRDGINSRTEKGDIVVTCEAD